MILGRLEGRLKNWQHFFISLREVIKYRYPARKMVVIGVTGTDGKTTTCHLIYEFLKEAGKQVALVSTIGAYFKKQKINTGFHTTTPDATVLQPLIAKLLKQGIKYLVLETTSHGLDQHRVLGCNFSVGVLTNVTHEHLDYHKSFENYRQAKAKLFKKVKIAILNKDDPSFFFFKRAIRPATKVISYSLEKTADLKPVAVEINSSGMRFSIESGKERIELKTRLIGDYNLSNILAAIGVTMSLGVDWNSIRKALANFKGVRGRMQIVDIGQPFLVIVDFAHTPNALEKVLKTLKKLKAKQGRLITVFGCAGERDFLKRPIMGQVATKLADISIFTAEDPRHEKVEDIIEQIVAGADKKKVFFCKPDRQEAINFAIKLAQPKDVVVICGKGHERSMAYGDQELPWSDLTAAKKALKRFSRRENIENVVNNSLSG